MELEPIYYVFGDIHSDCGNPVNDYLGKYDTLEKAEEIREIFAEVYDEITIEVG